MKTYKLLKDIHNPDHDKRRAYGYQKLNTFKAGTFFEGKPVSVEEHAWRAMAFISCKEWGHVNGDLAALLIGSSVETEPNNWHEIATTNGGCHHMADDVLENLIREGAYAILKAEGYKGTRQAIFDQLTEQRAEWLGESV
jgi:hypothetical protein